MQLEYYKKGIDQSLQSNRSESIFFQGTWGWKHFQETIAAPCACCGGFTPGKALNSSENLWPSKVGLRLIECFAAPFPPGTMQHNPRKKNQQFHSVPFSSIEVLQVPLDNPNINPINLRKACPSALAFYKQWPWHAMMEISLWEAFQIRLEVLNGLDICEHWTWSLRLHLRYICTDSGLVVQSRTASRSNLHAAWATTRFRGEPSWGWGPPWPLPWCSGVLHFTDFTNVYSRTCHFRCFGMF